MLCEQLLTEGPCGLSHFFCEIPISVFVLICIYIRMICVYKSFLVGICDCWVSEGLYELLLTIFYKCVIWVTNWDFIEYTLNGLPFSSHTCSSPEVNSWVKAFRFVISIVLIKTLNESCCFCGFQIVKNVTMVTESSRASCGSFIGHIKGCQFDVEAVRVTTFPFLLLQCQVGPGNYKAPKASIGHVTMAPITTSRWNLWVPKLQMSCMYTLGLRQNGHHLADDIFKCIVLLKIIEFWLNLLCIVFCSRGFDLP